ncbi:MAG: YbjQ family protein [Proteobacteria bacterium]|nr:YbjQ family protein [Pseudomonadota bacterium]
MIITTINHVPEMKIVTHFGVVSGSTVKAKHVGNDILAGIKNFFGGEIGSYTDLLESARETAVQRMVSQAEQAGANAIINVRMATSAITSGAAEIYVYGTAVVVK